MRLGNDKHALNTVARAFLAEHHLEDGMVDGLASNLPAKEVQFAVRDLEVARRVLVL